MRPDETIKKAIIEWREQKAKTSGRKPKSKIAN